MCASNGRYFSSFYIHITNHATVALLRNFWAMLTWQNVGSCNCVGRSSLKRGERFSREIGGKTGVFAGYITRSNRIIAFRAVDGGAVRLFYLLADTISQRGNFQLSKVTDSKSDSRSGGTGVVYIFAIFLATLFSDICNKMFLLENHYPIKKRFFFAGDEDETATFVGNVIWVKRELLFVDWGHQFWFSCNYKTGIYEL